MVLQAQLYSPHGGYQGYPHGQGQGNGYGHDFYSKNEHDYKEEQQHYSEDGYYESGSSNMQMTRPNISTSQPIKHFVVSPHQENGFGKHQESGYSHQESGFGKHQNYYGHSNSHGNGYPHTDSSYGKTHGLGSHGSGSHGYGKPSSGMYYGGSNGGYESHHESHMQIGPGRFGSSMNSDYYGHGGSDRYPSYNDQHNKNWGGKGADQWISKCL